MQDRTERRQVEAIANSTRFLEEQLRELKASVVRQQQNQERVNGQIETMLNRLEALGLGHQELAAHYQVVHTTQAEIHRLADQVAASIEKQTTLGSRVEELARQRLASLEREREERDAAARRLDAAERTTQTWENRMVVLDEIGHRMQESGAETGQRLERLERSLDSLSGRTGRNLEASKRLEAELGQIESLVDTLQRQDETVLERVQLLNEVIHRTEDEVAAVASHEERYQDVLDKVELQRVERLRVEEMINRMERQLDEQRSLIDHMEHVAATLEGRAKGFAERLDRLVEDTTQFRSEILGYLQRFGQVQERHKRRQIQDLETEIRDLKRHAIKIEESPPDGQPE